MKQLLMKFQSILKQFQKIREAASLAKQGPIGLAKAKIIMENS
jgi:hypothetical protein